ncbi:F-box domain-containing protein [Mycena chlorophos]|uniref:F-box domain-containing protein n=1 Tax=Mycena chlorophos TaxID=658473 RepID=A0A8H6TGS3_MYCCL|nr:F-box domain-containing protein [Mycena chlorophos]
MSSSPPALPEPTTAISPTQQPETPAIRAPAGHATRLPLDVLGEIFQHAAVQNFTTSSAAGCHLHHSFQLRLLAVSRSWRHAALSTHRLWNRLLVGCADDGGEKMAKVIHTWLSRSGALPLSIVVGLPNTVAGQTRIMDVLLGFAARWSIVHITPMRSHHNPLPFSTKFWPAKMPLLQSLTIYGSVKLKLTQNQHQTWPSLRELHLGREFEPSFISGNLALFRQLTQLSLHLDEPAALIPILMHCDALEHLEVEIDSEFTDLDHGPGADVPIRLDHLVHLGLGEYGVLAIPPSLTVPRLDSLSVANMEDAHIQCISALLERSQCPVTHVQLLYNAHLPRPPGDEGSWIIPLLPFLASLPISTTKLALECTDWTRNDFIITAAAVALNTNLHSSLRKFKVLILTGTVDAEEMKDPVPVLAFALAWCLGPRVPGMPAGNLPSPPDSDSEAHPLAAETETADGSEGGESERVTGQPARLEHLGIYLHGLQFPRNIADSLENELGLDISVLDEEDLEEERACEPGSEL